MKAINMAWSNVKVLLTSYGLIVADHRCSCIDLHPLKNVEITIQMLLTTFLPLTSTETSLPKTMRG